MKTYRIRPLLPMTMELDMGILMYRYKYGTKFQSPAFFWYIEGADQNILVDSSADAELAMSHRGFPTEKIMSFEEALSSVGLKPADIDLVIQTHLHWDHCANTSKCKNAKVLVTEEELRFALAPHPLTGGSYKKELLQWKDMDRGEVTSALDTSYNLLDNIKENKWTKENITEELMKKADEIGDRGRILWPLRVALSGKKASAGPFEIAEVLGREKTLKRLKQAMENN